ncbi:YafY family transcriptional regulator [Pseudonocardiaceae bacterium YIM PH 21723]|nr:YafY family transcriptional regulator [Pseudonocardiaceae bacterium YIM PH 21723]
MNRNPTRETSTERLSRLLSLVPYLLARPGILVTEAAEDLRITPAQLRKDLELLWMCGLPGYGPGDLIDLSFEEDTITVSHDAGMRRPLRLTGAEATALLVALRAIGDTPTVADPQLRSAVDRAVAKIESAVGQAQPAGVVVGLAARESARAEAARPILQEAITRHRAVGLRYYTASRDEITERVIDPLRLLIMDGRSYLEAWCRRAEDVRMFRLDRVDRAEVLDEPADPPADAARSDFSDGVWRQDDAPHTATLMLRPDARWIAEYYPVQESAELAHGCLRVTMKYWDPSWMVRLLLGQGGEAVVEGPPELVTRLRDRALAALQADQDL